MRRIVVIAALLVGLGALVARSGVYEQTPCPACQGTGRILSGAPECGTQDQRTLMLRRKSAYPRHCYTSRKCHHCDGGRVDKEHSHEIPRGAYVVRDGKGRNASVILRHRR